MTSMGAVIGRGGWRLPVIGATALINSLATLALPAALGAAVDAMLTGTGAGRYAALIAILIAVTVACDLASTYAETYTVAGTAAWLRERLTARLLGMGPWRLARFDTGDLVSRISSHAVDAARAGTAVVGVATQVIPPLGCLVLLFLIDVAVAAAFLAGVALVGLVLWLFSRRTAEVASGYQRLQGVLAGRLSEALAGARTIAAAGTLGQERQRVLEPLPELAAHGSRIWAVLARTSAQAAVVGPLVLVAVLAVGGFALLDGRITPGELFAASRYAMLGAGLGALTGVLGALARARAGIGRAQEIFQQPATSYGSRELPPGPGTLEFRDVTVRQRDATLLSHVDLVVPGGCAAAVVGPSGAGKSVLAALAARLRDPDAGQVRLDGVPLEQLLPQQLRTAIGCAFERPVLVGEAVEDAIRLGRDPAAARAAARAAGAEEFISRLPEGYHTPLPEAPFSGGEAQRVGLARAWYADRLLVLDDATASLDMVTEMRISRTLTEDQARRTRLIVTHRAATAARADLVIWLAGGEVRAVGAHQQLWSDPDYRAVFAARLEPANSGNGEST